MGSTSLDQAEGLLAQGLGGVMIGRAAYHAPWDVLARVDARIFGAPQPAQTPFEVVEAMIPYIERHLSEGGRLHDVSRHMMGLFAGRPGARSWRRALSEAAQQPSAGPQTLIGAMEQVRDANALRSLKPRAGATGIQPFVKRAARPPRRILSRGARDGSSDISASRSSSVIAPHAAISSPVRRQPMQIPSRRCNDADVDAGRVRIFVPLTPGPDMAQPVQRALQDVGGGDVVDDLGPAAARGVGLEQRAFGRDGRQPLVPEADRQVGQAREVAGEGAGRLAARTLGAVHVARQAQDRAADPALVEDLEQLRSASA